MANNEDYTGKKIKDTYKSILHLGSDSNVYDGTGSIIIPKNFTRLISQSIDFTYTSSVTYIGATLSPTFFSVCVGENPCGIYSSGSFIVKEYSGLCIKQFPPKTSPTAYSKLSSFTFRNLVGIVDDFNISNYHTLKEIHLPSLKYVIGNLSWNNSENIERCDVSSLEYVGSFLPNSGSIDMNSMDLPSLSNCAGDFSPSTLLCNTMNIDNLHYIGGRFGVTNLTNLTNISGSSLISIGGDFNPTSCSNAHTMIFNNLTNIHGNFNPVGLPLCDNISFNKLVYVGGNFSPVSMSVLLDNIGNQFPLLEHIEGDFTLHVLESCSSVSFGELVTVSGSYSVSNMDNLLEINHPNLLNIRGVKSVFNNINLTTITLPNIQRVEGGLHYYNCPNLSDINIGYSLSSLGFGDVNITDASLSPYSVEIILQSLARLDGTNSTTLWGSGRTVNLSGGTSCGIALLTPSAILSRNILSTRGVVVILNN
jgi:hypothetical protein